MSKLSLAMIVKNEARCLARCLQSVRGVVDEIVIADTGSTDQTVQIATEHGAVVSTFAWTDDFSAARNFSLQQAHGDWILVLDADEWLSPESGQEIRAFIDSQPKTIGRLKIVSSFVRNGQTLQSQTFVTRLFPYGGHFEGQIHEQVISPHARQNLQGEVWHDGYLLTNKSERNLRLLLREVEKAPENVYWLYQLACEYTSLNQTKEALGCLQKAYGHLKHGDPNAPNVVVDYLYGLMESKNYDTGIEIIRKFQPALDDFPDFYFACGLFYMNLVRSNPGKFADQLPRIEQSYRKCLELGETEKYRSVWGTGSFLAMYNLGVLYDAFGESELARRFFEQAAALDYEPAQRMLEQKG